VNAFRRRTRSAWALAPAAAVVALAFAATTASAAPVRTATTTSYNTATFLQDNLSFPATDTTPVIQPVTYDYFQWLLQQPGDSAFLVGDPSDASFAARAEDVETAAKADGVTEIYWFDPNLSGDAKVGSITEPNLDIRNPAGITSLIPASQTIYGAAWLTLVGQYLGDGVTATIKNPDTESATGTAAIPGAAATTNNTASDSTEFENQTTTAAPAPFNYVGDSGYPTTLPSGATDSYFFIYDNGHTVGGNAENIVDWIDLDSEAVTASPAATASQNTQADVASAISLVGGASSLTDYTQFNWWESEATLKENAIDNGYSGGSTASGVQSPQPLLTAANGSAANGGWRIDQIPYPELVDLLKTDTSSTAVILFGGTWCPNTRPVVPAINQYAQENNVEVFNFDTVLDGGTVGGGTTSSTDPLQSRNTTTVTGSAQSNPTFLYGDLVSTYLKNVDTQYTPPGTDVNYYQGGNTSTTQLIANKLQVPFLIGYQASDGGGVNRQWIVNNGSSGYVEYMSSWPYTDPQPYELGLSSIPLDAPIWSTLNTELASFTWQTNPATLDPNSAIDTDDVAYLSPSETATVEYTPATAVPVAAAAVSVVAGTPSPLPASPVLSTTVAIDPTALATAVTALGTSAEVTALTNLGITSPVVTYLAAKTALIDAEADLVAASPVNSSSADTTLIGSVDTVVGAWGTDSATVKYTAAGVGSLTVASGSSTSTATSPNTITPVSITTEALSAALSALGSSAPANYAAARTALIAADIANTTPTLIANLDTVVGAWGVAQSRKTSVINAWGSETWNGNTQAESVYAGVNAVHALDVFFGGLPGAVVSTQTVFAPAVVSPAAPHISITIANQYGAVPTGNVSLTVQQNGSTIGTASTAVVNDVASFTLPTLAAGTYSYTLSYQGDGQIVSFTDNGSLTVSAAASASSVLSTSAAVVTPPAASLIEASKLVGVVFKAQTRKVNGKYEVTIVSPTGSPTASGKVTIEVKKGSTVKTLTGSLSNGAVTVRLPKLAAGTWKVTILWPGDSNYLPDFGNGASIKIKK
jgi:thiol-disulfide isomerase/thioredoxin